jgi:DNA-binding response OmpR family regulator
MINLEKVKTFKSALIIDDDRDLCMLLKTILNSTIPDVWVTQTLESGKKLFSELKPDVVFLDNNLPDGHGVDSITELKATVPASMLVIITAMDNSREKSLADGADVFLQKPLTVSSIQYLLNSASTR